MTEFFKRGSLLLRGAEGILLSAFWFSRKFIVRRSIAIGGLLCFWLLAVGVKEVNMFDFRDEWRPDSDLFGGVRRFVDLSNDEIVSGFVVKAVFVALYAEEVCFNI